jgi:hypothetical protein
LPGLHTGPTAREAVLRRHPSLALVIAHLGSPEYADFVDITDRYPNVFLDTTMAFTDYFEEFSPVPPAVVSRLPDLRDRIVLGSDFPNIPYPYAHQLEALDRLNLGEEWLRAVLWENGARLLRIAG